MHSPTDRYSKIAGVRARPVSEWENCIVYTPAQPNLHLLNLNAWLILELCDGSQLAEIERRYRDAVDGRVDARDVGQQLVRALARLVSVGIVERQTA